MSEAIRKQYCVGGVWKDSKTEKWMPVTDSSTGEVIAEVPSCTQDEVLEAIDAQPDEAPEEEVFNYHESGEATTGFAELLKGFKFD